jgi:hypothetical protein
MGRCGMGKRKIKKAAKLINGDTMHAMHPETFAMPSAAERRMIQAGDVVKIGMVWDIKGGTSGERFWVRVKARDGEWFEGLVNNHLLNPEHTGCNYGDIVQFHAAHIIDIDHSAEDGSASSGVEYSK